MAATGTDIAPHLLEAHGPTPSIRFVSDLSSLSPRDPGPPEFMGLATSTWGPWKPIFSIMNTSDQSFISCIRPPALERLRKQWGIQSNVICHPGKRLDGKSPIIGLLSRGKWKVIAGNNTKVPQNREVLICETSTSEKTPNMQLLLWTLLERSVYFEI